MKGYAEGIACHSINEGQLALICMAHVELAHYPNKSRLASIANSASRS